MSFTIIIIFLAELIYLNEKDTGFKFILFVAIIYTGRVQILSEWRFCWNVHHFVLLLALEKKIGQSPCAGHCPVQIIVNSERTKYNKLPMRSVRTLQHI